MIIDKNNIPIIAEEQIIEEEQLNLERILSQFKQPAPFNFLKLENINYMCSTQGWKEPRCERYNCLINSEWKQVDIPYTILQQLELDKNQVITYPVYLSPTILDKGLDNYFAYNIDNETEIFLDKPLTIKNFEQSLNRIFTQIQSLEKDKEDGQETIDNLKKELEEAIKLKSVWRDKFLEEKATNNQEIQAQISELTRERDHIQQELTNQQAVITDLQNEITGLNDNLLTIQQERDQIQASLKRSVLGSLFKNKQKNKRISELNNSLAWLRSLLINRNHQITNLTNERDNLQNQVNDLNQQLTNLNTLITNVQNLLGVDDLNNLPLLPPGETLAGLLARPTLTDLQAERDRVGELERKINEKDEKINRLITQKNNLQTELDREKGWWDKWFNDKSNLFELNTYFGFADSGAERLTIRLKFIVSPFRSHILVDDWYFGHGNSNALRSIEYSLREEVGKIKPKIKEIYQYYKQQR